VRLRHSKFVACNKALRVGIGDEGLPGCGMPDGVVCKIISAGFSVAPHGCAGLIVTESGMPADPVPASVPHPASASHDCKLPHTARDDCGASRLDGPGRIP
jgi:hypothetical protein